jgi:6-phosphogluconolactonase
MITRRTFLSISASSLALPLLASAKQLSSRKVALYTNISSELLHYDVDVANATLVKRGSVTLPSCVQYAWPHASRRYLYVASSDFYTDQKSTQHYVTALRIDPQTGELSKHGEPVQLPARPIHITTDIPSEHVLVPFNQPSGVRIFHINKDFTIGSEIPQPGLTDGGIYAHQVRVTLDNGHVILVTRGNSATPRRPEEPGALKIFDYKRGILSNEASIAPNGGMGFGPRHLDFHPTKPWVYVSLERQSKLYMFRMEKGRPAAAPAYIKETVAEPNNMRPRQLAGTIHVHPNGRFVYVANRNEGTVDFNGKKVSDGGENTIAVYSINQNTGEPTLIQRADTRKAYPRTFHIDPSRRLMVVQCTVPINFREGNDVREAPSGLTLFRIGDDGKLTFERTHEMNFGKETGLWMGIVGL